MELNDKERATRTMEVNDKERGEKTRSIPTDKKEYAPAGAQDTAGEPSAITPGAVFMRGSNIVGRNRSQASLDLGDDEDHHESAALNSDFIIPATLVDDNRTSTASHKIIEQVRNAVLKDTLEAEIIKDDDVAKKPVPKSSRSWRKVALYSILALVVVGVAIFLLVFFLVRDKHTSTKTTPSSSTEEKPKDPSCIYCVENATYDFPLNSSLSVLELLDAGPQHKIFSNILNITGINGYLTADYNATLFAPTDEAFDALPVPYHYYIVTYDWIYHLVTLIFSHMSAEVLNSTEVFGLDEIPTNGGFNLTVDRANKTIADLAKILIADIPASNGYIHVPDRVFLTDELRTTLPDTAKLWANVSGFSKFQELVEFVNLNDILVEVLPAGLTLFAPSDSAFDELDKEFVDGLTSPGNENKTRDIVLYHLVRYNLYQDVIIQFNQNLNLTEVGDSSYNKLSLWFSADVEASVAFVNTATIIEQRLAQNGLVNVIDKVLIPPTIDDLLRTTTNVTASYSFKTFLGIVDGPAKLSTFFTQDGPLTLFAPLEVAFKSKSAQLQRWLEPGWLLHLQSFVRYHCVPQAIRNSDLLAGIYNFQTLSGFNTTIETLSGGNSTTDDLSWGSLVAGKYFGSPNITLDSGTNVTLKNLFAVNGIVYGIDTVLLPPWTKSDLNQTLSQKNEFSTFLALAKLSNLTSYLVGSGPYTVLAPNNTVLAAVVGDSLDVASLNITLIRKVLLQHIFEGNLYTSDLQASIVSESGYKFQGYTLNSQVFVGRARILESDVLCNNGVIHVIDQVMQVGV